MMSLPPRCCRLCLPPWRGVKPFNVTKLTKESWLGMAPHVLIPLQKAPQGARPNPKMSLLPQAASPMMVSSTGSVVALHWCLWGHGEPRGDKRTVLGPPSSPVGPGSPSYPMMAKLLQDGPFHALAAISEAAPPSSDTTAGCLLLPGVQGAAGHVPFPVAVPTISQPLGG